jgi:hypothetical protein
VILTSSCIRIYIYCDYVRYGGLLCDCSILYHAICILLIICNYVEVLSMNKILFQLIGTFTAAGPSNEAYRGKDSFSLIEEHRTKS